MLKKTTDKLHCAKCHSLPLGVAGLLVTESYLTIVYGKDATVGQGNSMNVTAEILKYLIGPLYDRLGIDHPVFMPCGRRNLKFQQFLRQHIFENSPKDF
jgi:hypothetical protein